MPVAIRSLQSLPERHGPTGRKGKRIATPVCALARNDVGCFTLCVFTLDFGEFLARPVRWAVNLPRKMRLPSWGGRSRH